MSFRDRLANLLKGGTPPEASSKSPEDQPRERHSQPTAEINIGIDFGTSFTKVCFRDVGPDQASVVELGSYEQADSPAMIPSTCWLSPDGTFYGGTPTSTEEAKTGNRELLRVDQLKMRLAALDLGDEMGRFHKKAGGLDQEHIIELVSVCFLSNVLWHARRWIQSNRPELLRGRKAIWSANIGVPVRIYDSPAIHRFGRVLEDAWRLQAERSQPVKTLDEARTALARLDREGAVNCFAMPELIAAIDAFVTSPGARDGMYVFMDVGGGTLDGVSFHYERLQGEPKVRVYSAIITALGVEGIAHRRDKKVEEFKRKLLSEEQQEKLFESLRSVEVRAINKQTAGVIMGAKRLDPQFFRHLQQQHDWQLGLKKEGGPKDPNELGIFFGGGGKDSWFYRASVTETYMGHRLDRADIPPFRLLEVPKAENLHLGGVEESKFHRFSIAYGLTLPKGAGPDFVLPSELDEIAKIPVAEIIPAGIYDD